MMMKKKVLPSPAPPHPLSLRSYQLWRPLPAGQDNIYSVGKAARATSRDSWDASAAAAAPTPAFASAASDAAEEPSAKRQRTAHVDAAAAPAVTAPIDGLLPAPLDGLAAAATTALPAAATAAATAAAAEVVMPAPVPAAAPVAPAATPTAPAATPTAPAATPTAPAATPVAAAPVAAPAAAPAAVPAAAAAAPAALPASATGKRSRLTVSQRQHQQDMARSWLRSLKEVTTEGFYLLRIPATKILDFRLQPFSHTHSSSVAKFFTDGEADAVLLAEYVSLVRESIAKVVPGLIPLRMLIADGASQNVTVGMRSNDEFPATLKDVANQGNDAIRLWCGRIGQTLLAEKPELKSVNTDVFKKAFKEHVYSLYCRVALAVPPERTPQLRGWITHAVQQCRDTAGAARPQRLSREEQRELTEQGGRMSDAEQKAQQQLLAMLDEALQLSEYRHHCEVECRDAEDILTVLEMAATNIAADTLRADQLHPAAVLHERLELAEAAAVAAEGAVLMANRAARCFRAALDAALNEAAEAAGAEPVPAEAAEHRMWATAQQTSLDTVRSSELFTQWEAAHAHAYETVARSVRCARVVEVAVAAASVADALESTLDNATEVRCSDATRAAAAALLMHGRGRERCRCLQ